MHRSDASFSQTVPLKMMMLTEWNLKSHRNVIADFPIGLLSIMNPSLIHWYS